MRAGAHALSLLAVPLRAKVLVALEDEALPLADLRRAVGSLPATTMREHLAELIEIGALKRHQEGGVIAYELGPPGRKLLGVANHLQRWLDEAPGGPLELGRTAAKGPITALTRGWSAGIVRALAARPLSLTELSSIISGLSYPSLERRLAAMRFAGQIEPRPGNEGRTPYQVTDWLRKAVAPIASAARWEADFLADRVVPTTRIDIEATFLLAAPLIRLPREDFGACRLAVECRNERGDKVQAGAMATVAEGRISSCVSSLEGGSRSWALGSAAGWMQALIEGDSDALQIGGNPRLAGNLVESLHATLFKVPESV